MISVWENLIQKYAQKFNIDQNWVKAIISTESDWNQYALRYESSYQYVFEIEKCAKRARVTLATELATQRISWGLGQIMGSLAREQGHTTSLSELCDPETNIVHLCTRLSYLKLHAGGIESSIFAGYNGGLGALRKVNNLYLNQKYVDTVNSHLDKLLT